ncbi:MAG TPA: glycosyltransferase family 2 protein [Armatimonadota bacterium]|nr:glycosyltransferase family 2 protein [Armatimonadota bacterium]
MLTNTGPPRSDNLPHSSQRSPIEISVVVPLYNEEQNVKPLHGEVTDALRNLGRAYEVIFVDDGSTDGSPAILDELASADPAVEVMQLRRNFGKAVALSAGFGEARGDIVITIDADLQDNPAEIPRFVAGIESGYDLVSGWKYRRRDPLSKTVPSRLFNKVVSMATGLDLHDFNCGFKAYSRSLVDALQIYGELHRYIPALAYGDGFRVTEIKVEHRPRKHGRSKYGLERYTRGLLDLLTVLFITRYTRRPLHLFGSLGLVLVLLGLGMNAYLAVLWFTGHPIGHRPLLTLGVLLMVLGVQFVSTGLVGEMITRSQKHDEDSHIARRIRGSSERGRQS